MKASRVVLAIALLGGAALLLFLLLRRPSGTTAERLAAEREERVLKYIDMDTPEKFEAFTASLPVPTPILPERKGFSVYYPGGLPGELK